MKDHDLENQINVKLDDTTFRHVTEAAKASEMFKGEIVRKAVIRCIRQDNAPKWKRFIAKLIRY